MTRSSLDCVSGGMFPDLVEEDRAPVGDLEQALLVRHGAGEGALDVAEQGALEQFAGHRPGVHGDERPVAALRVVVDRLGDQLLAGAALAADQDVALGRRGPADQVEHLADRPALADDAVEPLALSQLLLEVAVLGGQATALQALADGEPDLFVLERLGQVVEGALPHRLDRALDGGVGGDHDDDLVRVALADAAHDLPAVHVRQHQVEQHQVDLLLGEHGQRLLARGAADRVVPLLPDQGGEDVLQDLFVVDDEDVHSSFSFD